MNGEPPSIEAVEWRQPAPGGGSQAQVFRLVDNRFAMVKFRENPQGEIVLVNEFLCCQLAERFQLPVNRSVIVSVVDALLPLARQQGLPAAFSAGFACGLIRFDNTEGADPNIIQAHCANRDSLHHLIAFEQLVCRQDGRQLLMYTPEGQQTKSFAAYDYGFAFGGTPVWSAPTLAAAPPTILPQNDPFTNQPYLDGILLAPFINQLRNFTKDELRAILMRLA